MKRIRLKPFLLTIMVSFVSLFLLLTIVPVYFGVFDIVNKQTSKSYLDLNQNNLRHITERLKELEGLALSISRDRVLRDHLDALVTKATYDLIVMNRELSAWLNNFIYINPYISSIQLFLDGSIPRVHGAERIQPLSSIDWMEQLAAVEKVDSMWLPQRIDYFSSKPDNQVLTYVMRLFNRKGDLSGYIEMNLKVTALWSLTEGKQIENLSSKRISFLYTSNGKLLASIAFNGNTPPIMAESWSFDFERLRTDDSFLERIDGEEYMFTNATDVDQRWRLIEIFPVDEVYRDVRFLRNLILLVGLGAFFLTFPIATLISNRIRRPVERLVKCFEKIGDADFTTRMDRNFITEFHQLSCGYNEMVQQIQSLLKRIELEHQAKCDAELRALQSQINPHFLYNTLDMINWMAIAKGNTEVSSMTTKLARLLRISLGRNDPIVTLLEELEHGRVYAQIQLERFANRFTYEEHIHEDFLDNLVPNIIIQPFIENAILHGFGNSWTQEACVMVSTEERESGCFALIVEDNGKGLDESQLLKSNSEECLYASEAHVYGIKNVSERIKMYFGDASGVKVSNRSPSGVRVEITIPIVLNRIQL